MILRRIEMEKKIGTGEENGTQNLGCIKSDLPSSHQ